MGVKGSGSLADLDRMDRRFEEGDVSFATKPTARNGPRTRQELAVHGPHAGRIVGHDERRS